MPLRSFTRRDFLRLGAGAAALAPLQSAGAVAGSSPIHAERRKPLARNLVPSWPGKTPSYWCTWGLQNYSLEVPDELTHATVANNLTEAFLFGEPGWATDYFRRVRRDLYIVYDLGWDIPPGLQFDKERWRLGTLEVATGKFPSCTGTPAERLKKLNELTKAAGWRGAGIWVAAQAVGDGKDGKLMEQKPLEAYFRERARWSHEAGIEYWKVDYGARGGNPAFRRMLTQIAREEAPGLRLEHARGCSPANDEEVAWEELVANRKGSYRTWDNGRILEQALELLEFSDVLRTYDVTAYFSVPTTLDRVAQILAGISARTRRSAILNCEDEPYLGAALGCAVGIMRHPLWREYEDKSYDPIRLSKRMDEVTRAVRWQRLAPAAGVGETKVVLDDELQIDDWVFRKGDTWAHWLLGREVIQGAPGRVARGMPLPKVKGTGPRPYVVASRHPDGAVAVATLPRLSKEKAHYFPLVDVSVDIGDGDSPVGIFGRFRSLTLNLSGDIGRRRLLAQDLAGEEAFDITDDVRANGGSITLGGRLLAGVGLSARSGLDGSGPGLVLQFM